MDNDTLSPLLRERIDVNSSIYDGINAGEYLSI